MLRSRVSRIILVCVRSAIARNARRLLRPGGRLYFEIHENFADETLRMLTREGFPDTAVRRDLNDKNRMTCSLQRR